MSPAAWSEETEGGGSVDLPLRLAFALSLLLHGGLLYWFQAREVRDEAVAAPRSFEVTLSRSRPAQPLAAPVPPAAPETHVAGTPEPGISPEPAPRQIRAPARPAPPAASVPGPRLDLSLSDDIPGPREALPDDGVFDPALRERIRAARAARAGPVPRPGARTWARAGGTRTFVETERGCFERVDDPFSGEPGQQWWLVACGAGERIDWGQRFRARP